jgi:hypothetical protein
MRPQTIASCRRRAVVVFVGVEVTRLILIFDFGFSVRDSSRRLLQLALKPFVLIREIRAVDF